MLFIPANSRGFCSFSKSSFHSFSFQRWSPFIIENRPPGKSLLFTNMSLGGGGFLFRILYLHWHHFSLTGESYLRSSIVSASGICRELAVKFNLLREFDPISVYIQLLTWCNDTTIVYRQWRNVFTWKGQNFSFFESAFQHAVRSK